ncbi:hypothetical protein GCM10011511_49900 [Puia dinghuensis]|uniref:Secretion system C-terminal sorting domain-containing protein n=1 Tax=Puia dinghuensis TaxID=1792502 RepID=A0A8J2UHT3_9BACT|nr:hypothetical protein GCM10011511_49900 [Puia dinghuensis]
MTHNPFTNFNSTPNPGTAASAWLAIHTKLTNTDLTANGDFLLFSGGTISLTGVTSTPTVTNVAIPNGQIVADASVSTPVTTFDITTNTWTTRVPPGFSSSDIFISGAIINSSTGFSVSAGKESTVTGSFFSNKPSFSSSWFYGIGAYEPEFSYSAIAGAGQVSSVGGGVQAGTPIPEESHLVAGGSGGGGSNFTGSNSSTDNFTTCQKSVVCNLSGTIQKTDVTCFGAATGNATITLTGGTPPFSFNNGEGVFLTTSNAVTNFPNIPAGTYPLIITDGAGCTINLSLTISQPPAIQVSGVVVNAGNNQSNGSITVTVSGGTPPYTFLWNTGAQTQNLSGIGQGTYTLTVTDANGCTSTLTENLTAPACTFTMFNVAATALKGSSQNACDGAAAINVSGGTAPYTYAWSDGVTTAANTRTDLCGLTATGNPFIYTVVVTDANKLTASVSFSLCAPAVATTAGSPLATGAGAKLSLEAAGTFTAKVYPNPSDGLTYLLINSPERSNAAVNLIDMDGRVIKSYIISLEAGTNNKELQIPTHAPGIYTIQIKTDKDFKTLPIMLH